MLLKRNKRYRPYLSNDMKHTIPLFDGMQVQKPIGNFACHIEHWDDYVMNDAVLKLDLLRLKGWITAPEVADRAKIAPELLRYRVVMEGSADSNATIENIAKVQDDRYDLVGDRVSDFVPRDVFFHHVFDV